MLVQYEKNKIPMPLSIKSIFSSADLKTTNMV